MNKKILFGIMFTFLLFLPSIKAVEVLELQTNASGDANTLSLAQWAAQTFEYNGVTGRTPIRINWSTSGAGSVTCSLQVWQNDYNTAASGGRPNVTLARLGSSVSLECNVGSPVGNVVITPTGGTQFIHGQNYSVLFNVSASSGTTNNIISTSGSQPYTHGHYMTSPDGGQTWNEQGLNYDVNVDLYSEAGATVGTNFTITATDVNELNKILNFTANITGSLGSQIYQSNSTGSLVTPYLSNQSELINISLSSQNYFNRTYLIYNISSDLAATLLNVRAKLNVTAIDLSTSLAIQNFTISLDGNGESQLNSTTGYTLFTRGLWNKTYNVFITASGYESLNSNNTNRTYNFSSYSGNLVFRIWPANSINMNVSDEQTRVIITQNLSLILTSLSFSNTYTFLNGNFLLQNLSPDTYRLDFSNANYSLRTYYVTLQNGSTNFLQAWLLQNSSSQSTQFITRDQLQNLIPGATYTFTRLMGSNYVTVAQKTTDISGTITVNLQPLITYRILITAPLFQTKQIDLEIAQNQYTVFLSENQSISFRNFQGDVTYLVNPTSGLIVPNNSSNFTLTTNSPSGYIINFGALTTFNNVSYLTNVTGSPSGGTAILTLNTSHNIGDHFSVTYFIVTQGGQLSFNQSYTIFDFDASLSNSSVNSKLIQYRDQINPFYRFLMAILISLIIGAGFFTLIGAMGASVLAYVVFLGFGISGFISWVFPTVTGILIVLGYIVTGGNDGT